MFPAIIVIEVSCFATALFFLKNTGNVVWTTIKWFILFAVLVEASLSFTGKILHWHNGWIINLYTPINFFIVSWSVYRLSPYNKINLAFFIAANFIFLLFFLLEIFTKGFFAYSALSSVLSDCLLFIICNRFFYLLLKQDEWIEIQKHAAFWFVTGLFLFNFCSTVADIFDEQLNDLYIFSTVSLRYVLYIVFNLILYSCWSFAFICRYQETI